MIGKNLKLDKDINNFADELKKCFSKDEIEKIAGERLKAMIKTTAMLLRNGVANEIFISELVPGDVVQLAAGDMIPADVRIIFAKDLFISQSSMTGESEPVEKHAELLEVTKDKNISSHLGLENLAYMGTNVMRIFVISKYYIELQYYFYM